MIKIVVRKCLVRRYLALRENLADQAAFKGMGGKRKEFMLKWVPNPKEKLKSRVV